MLDEMLEIREIFNEIIAFTEETYPTKKGIIIPYSEYNKNKMDEFCNKFEIMGLHIMGIIDENKNKIIKLYYGDKK